jgi:hypothetical protein
VAQLQPVSLGSAYTYFEIKSEQTLSLGVEEKCVEGDGEEPDVDSVVAVPRLSCETRLFFTVRFHVWSYSIVRCIFKVVGWPY